MLQIKMTMGFQSLPAILLLFLLYSCSTQGTFSCQAPLSWVYPHSSNSEQLIRLTRWDLLRDQAEINESNYLDFNFWSSYGLNFSDCSFTLGNIEMILLDFDKADDKVVDFGKKELGISLLDVEWELKINHRTTVIKVSSNANFDRLETFLNNNSFVKMEDKESGTAYYKLDKNARNKNSSIVANVIAKQKLSAIPNLYFNKQERVVVISNRSEAILASVNTFLSKKMNPTLAALDCNFIDQAFETSYSVLFSNREHSIKSQIRPKETAATMDLLCQELFKISYSSLKKLNEIDFRIMGLFRMDQSAKIVAVYKDATKAKEDQVIREALVLEANSFITNKLWNGHYLTYKNSELT